MKVPPHSIEAEKSVLGCAMLDNKALNYIVRELEPEDFYYPEHVKIAEIAFDLFNKSKNVDVISVNEKLNNLDYLVGLTDTVPTTQSLKTHLGIVKAKSVRRKYINAAYDIADMAYDGDFENMTDFKNEAMAKMDIEVKATQSNNTAREVLEIVYKNIEERYKSQNETKLYTGIDWLDKYTGGQHAPDVTIIAARPSVGKTAFALQIAINLLKKQNHVAIFNLEMGKEQIMERMICNLSGIDTGKIRNPKIMREDDHRKFANVSSMIAEMNLYLYDDEFYLEGIRAEARNLKNKGKLDVLMVDYLGLMDTRRKYNSTNDKVSILSRGMKMLAKEMKIPVVLLSQLNRQNEHDKRQPKLRDLRDSGSIEQDADNVYFLHDPNAGNYEDSADAKSELELIIAKQRNGMRDIFKSLDFYKSTQRIY